MAKNTTATGSVIDGVTVVHPDNIGKSLKFAGKEYDVNVGQTLQVTEKGLVEVKLSPDRGNLLESRGNGLYYGVEAPADTSNLYVSSSKGDDKNAGTREAPLRTIVEAMRRNKPNQRFRVFLFEDDTHEWSSEAGIPERLFTMEPYGPVADYVFANTVYTSKQHFRAKELKRPKLVFVADWENGIYKSAEVMHPLPLGQILFNGLQISFKDKVGGSLPWLDTRPLGNADGNPNIWFRGCEFVTNPIREFIRVGSRTANIIFDACKVTGSDNILFLEEQALLSIGFRFMENPGLVNTKISGNKQDGTPTPLHYWDFSSKEDFIRVIPHNNRLIQGKVML